MCLWECLGGGGKGGVGCVGCVWMRVSACVYTGPQHVLACVSEQVIVCRTRKPERMNESCRLQSQITSL